MGNEQSAPKVYDEPYPKVNTIEGLSVGNAGTANVKLVVSPGISSASVRLSREFGDVTPQQCDEFRKDYERMSNGEMAFGDFKGKLQEGRYYTREKEGVKVFGTDINATNNAELPKFCKQVRIPDNKVEEIVDKQSFINAFWKGDGQGWDIPVTRIRPVTTSGGFSANTKVRITPSMPFKIEVTTETQKTEVQIKTLTLFHPCPVRIENTQYDAVLTLNDPTDATDIFLIPIKAESIPDDRATFFSRIIPYINGLMEANPATGEYTPIDVPTGNDWSLTKLFPVKPGTTGEPEIKDGFFTWIGTNALEKYRIDGPGFSQYKWRQAGNPVRYFMFQNPVPISSLDLGVLRRFPVTPSESAIHPVPTEFFYKTGPPTATACAKMAESSGGECTRETFCGKPECDPLSGFNTPEPSTDGLVAAVTTFIVSFGIAIAVYIAVKFAASRYPDILKRLGERIGRAIGGGNIQSAMRAVAARAQAAAPVISEEARQAEITRVREAERKAMEKRRERRRRVTPKQAETLKEIARRNRPVDIPEAPAEDQRAPAPRPAAERLPVAERVQNPLRSRPTAAEQREAAGTGLRRTAMEQDALRRERRGLPPRAPPVLPPTVTSLPPPPTDARRPKRRKIAMETPEPEVDFRDLLPAAERAKVKASEAKLVPKPKGGRRGKKMRKHTWRQH